MVTNDERRRIAAALRAYDGKDANADTIGETMAIIIGAGDFEGWSWREVFAHLADLIEPSFDRDAERTCRDTDCDTESITCSECGEITRYTLFWVDVDGGKTVKGHRPRFCSNCGRRVLYDSNDYI